MNDVLMKLNHFCLVMRADLQEIRIIQTNLVFLNGLDVKLSKEEVIYDCFQGITQEY